MLSPIDEIISELSDTDKPLVNAKLAELAGINPEEMERFKQAWPGIARQRQQQIVARLVALAEDNFDLDFDDIFKYCLSDPDTEVRSKAIEGLWENEEPALINTLLNILEEDSSGKVQAAAAHALGRFVLLAEQRKLHSSYSPKIYQTLLNIISDKSKPVEIKRRALEAVAPVCSPAVERAIREAYHGGNHDLKTSSIYAMGKSCNPGWLPILLKELSNADPEIRYEAAESCGEIGEEDATPKLIKLVNDRDSEVQMAVIRALGKVGGTEAKNCLEQCLDDPSEIVQQAAEQALYELNEGEEPLPF